jgi:hypothetical protein
MTITLDPMKPVVLDLTAERTTNTLYQYDIYELRPNTAATAAEAKRIYTATSATASVTLPNDVFETGKNYTVRAHCISGGFPSLTEGNLQNRNLPHSVGYQDSGWFTVSAP